MRRGQLNKTVMDPRHSFGSIEISPQMTVKYPLDSKHEERRKIMHNNHNNGRNFKINEELMKIYEANILL